VEKSKHSKPKFSKDQSLFRHRHLVIASAGSKTLCLSASRGLQSFIAAAGPGRKKPPDQLS
jgi:hypothetical protein